MRFLSVRLTISLILAITLVSMLSSYYQVEHERRSLRQDLERRAAVLAESLAANVENQLGNRSSKRLQAIVDRFSNRQHLVGIGIFDVNLQPIAQSPGLSQRMQNPALLVTQLIESGQNSEFISQANQRSLQAYLLPVHREEEVIAQLLIVHDATYIDSQVSRMWRDSFIRVLVQVLLIVLITVLIVRWSIEGPIARAALWIRALRTGKTAAKPAGVSDLEVFGPIAKEISSVAESLTAARSAAEHEAQLRDSAESSWTADRLSVHVRNKLAGSRLFVVSNREPYIHVHQGKVIHPVVPASGLVSALEPVLRACDGTWIAHGSGDADRETVDVHDRLGVPPDDPRYALRRVWLNKVEEEGYYYGFSNEGLWPLCHIAHTRPTFRISDWGYYEDVNKKFAKAALEEMSGTERPVLLVQDYHLALLPFLIKRERPDARVAIFWHIPWPSSESFGICPWQPELLQGMLGADLVGFHVQSHCTNFLQTIDRVLECRIDWEHFAVDRKGHRTVVKPFPIGVDTTTAPIAHTGDSAYLDRAALLRELQTEALFIGVGVDRVDYTKGIIERFLAIERMIEKYSMYQGKFTFLQIGAPSRTHIKRYHDLLADVEAEAERINWRFQTGQWKPIVFLKRHFSHDEIARFYRAADVCMVTSLHDGMNLVAKEFIAARQDEQGVLLLSRFTGAARELLDAVLVNPYDVERTADALHFALQMDPDERSARMRRMRTLLKEHNVYRWAGMLITGLCAVRVSEAESKGIAA